MKRRLFAKGMGLAGIALPLSSVLVACGGGASGTGTASVTGSAGSSAGQDTSYEVSPQPNRERCGTCPGRARLCSYDEALTLAERPRSVN